MGAVFGWKNLKGVAAFGNHEFRVFNPAKTEKHRYDTAFWNACIMVYLMMTFNPSGDDDTRNDASCEPTPRDVMRQRFHEQS